MLSTYKILTVTHKRTNLKEIGDFVIKTSSNDELQERLNGIKGQFHIDEFLYLPTCNRVMYFFTTEQLVDERFITHFFQSVNPTLPIETINQMDEIVQVYEGADALEHLLEVAASLDSLVIGERQILRQLREAYDQCHSWGLTGDWIRLGFQQALLGAKSVYANTKIGDKPVSIVSLAIQKMLNAHLSKDARILLVGAGQTNQLVSKFLQKHHYNNVTVFNRSLDKAQKLASGFDGEGLTLDELYNYDKGFDVLIVCTGATTPIITEKLFSQLCQNNTDRKVIIDLAIPNNVTNEVARSEQVEYIEIEGLRNLAKVNLAFREQEVGKARVLIQSFLDEFPFVIKQRQLEIAMSAVPKEIRAVKSKAINEVFHKEVAQLDDSARALLEDMLTYMEKKCIGIPMKAARELAFV
jgi:glutamyl-tRNA reductase